MQLLFVAFVFISLVTAHTIQGIGSIKNQLSKREIDVAGTIFDNLPFQDQDFINVHAKELMSYNTTKCDNCKHRIRWAKDLLAANPENEHLVSLTLFKYCLDNNKNDYTKCNLADFFIHTHDTNKGLPDYYQKAGFGANSSVNFFDNDFLHMLKNFNVSSELDLEYYCYYKQNSACKLPETVDINSYYDFDSKWPAKEPKHFFEPDYGVAEEELELFNVLHITDFHTQLRYEVGSEANCTTGLCCIPESYNKDLPTLKKYNFSEAYGADGKLDYSFYPDAKYVSDKYETGEYYDFPKFRGFDFASVPANTFGGYKCDSPEILVNNTLQFIRNFNLSKNFEFSLFTGDLVDHDKVHCTPEVTIEAENLGLGLMKHYLNHIPVFPALGNHDTFPYGQLVPTKLDANSTYNYNSEMMSNIWVRNGWLPQEDAEEVKNHYSGFSTVTKRGLKIIALNSNAYYQKNLWSYINLMEEPDKFGQWQFLIDELVESEAQGQRVWILAHIPSTDFDALPIQSRIFAKIVERFSPYTVANIFYGHTHKDQFKVFYSSNTRDAEQIEKEVINMAWIGQSVTPYVGYNPAFKYYEVEDKSFNIRNAYSYYSKLNETFVNGGGEPVWELGYSARELYDPEQTWGALNPLNATFWNDYVLQKLYDRSNIELNQKYIDMQYRQTSFVPDCKNGTEITEECFSYNFCESGHDWVENYIKCSN